MAKKIEVETADGFGRGFVKAKSRKSIPFAA
jgi:hypothetical protein